MENELLYSVALSRVNGIGPVYAKKLLRFFGEARDVFNAGESGLTNSGIPPPAIRAILAFQNFSSLEKEMALLDRKGIRILLFTDPDYPQRLLPIETAPFLLFCKGKMDWNAKKMLAVIGTRDANEYGRQMTDQLIHDLVAPGPVIISGLASGIDGAAHRAALKYGLPTIGVLGHGFGYVYPPQNADLFRAMSSRGGLITEFPYDTPPDSYQFPFRNRIVAGMGDAVVVVETDTKGGSLGTIKKALEYGKKIFAVPGRLTDSKSTGCNLLIAKGEARLLFEAQQLTTEMQWETPGTSTASFAIATSASIPGAHEVDTPSAFPGVTAITPASTSATIPASPEFDTPSPSAGAPTITTPTQSTLFTSDTGLSEPEAALIKLLREKGSLSLDELAYGSALTASALAIALLHLELQDLVVTLPGNRYRPCT